MNQATDINIRAATTDDACSISALAIYVFLNTYATDGIRSDLANEALNTYSIDVFSSRINSPQLSNIYVAQTNQNMLGFIDVSSEIKPPRVDMAGGLEINTLYVQPGFHKIGIGKALLQCAEQQTLNRGVPLIWLTSWAENINAIAFYKHCGYVDVGSIDFRIAEIAYENRMLIKLLSSV